MWWIAALLAANPHLDEARRLYEQLKYPDAVARLRVARDAPSNSPQEQQQIADLLARALIAQGRTADAEKAWAELLAAQPDAPEPTDASPKIREVFQKAKRSVYPGDFVKLERGPSPPELLEATLTDPWKKVETVVLDCGAGPLPLPVARHVSAKLPENLPCTLSARDREGRAVAQLSATHSRVAPVIGAEQTVEPLPPSGPARWPAVVLGVLAVGAAAAGTALAVSSSMDYRQVTDATPAAQTHALDLSARNKAAAAWGAFGAAAVAGAATVVIVLRW